MSRKITDIDCHRVYQWLRHKPCAGSPKTRGLENLIGALTGQDSAALEAFVHAVSLYVRADEHGRRCALAAMRQLAEAAQPSTHPLFRESIAMVFDWGDRERLWRKMFGADLGENPGMLAGAASFLAEVAEARAAEAREKTT